MADQGFVHAIAALQHFEDTVASVDRHNFGGVYRCSLAPTLAPLNFVRVDDCRLGLDTTVKEVRAAADRYGLTAIVLDVAFRLEHDRSLRGARRRARVGARPTRDLRLRRRAPDGGIWRAAHHG